MVFGNQLARESGGWYLLRSVGDILVLFERSGCRIGGWGKAVGNISDCELEKRRQCIEEEKKDLASEFTFSRGCERRCGDRKLRLQSSSVRSCEKEISKKRGPEYARSDCSEARSWTTRPKEKKGDTSRCRRRIAKKRRMR